MKRFELHKNIFIFDLDGTLLRSDNTISSANMQALKHANDQGHIIAIATGRSLIKSKPILEQLPFVHFVICNNGNAIYNLSAQTSQIMGKIDRKTFQLVANFSVKNNAIFYVDTPSNSLVNLDLKIHKGMFDHKKPMDLLIAKNLPQAEINKLILSNDEPILQMAVRNLPENTSKAFITIKNMVANKYDVLLTNKVYVDIVPSGVDKSLALAYFKTYFSKAKIFAFGDSGNDLLMVKNADVGIAMGNSTDEVKAVASIIIGDHNSDSIANFLTDYLKNSL